MSGVLEPHSSAREVFPTPALEPVWLQRTRIPLQVTELPFWGRAGWARFTRKVVLTDPRPQDEGGLGRLLSAEWVDEHNRSSRIEFDPLSAGELAIFTLEEKETQSPECEPAWREVVIIDGDGPAVGRKLIYHVYLAERDDGEVYRLCDAFRGWEAN